MAYYRNRQNRKSQQKTNRTAYEAALHLLNYREQSEKELVRKLKDREYSQEEIEDALVKLKHYHFIDDASMAEDLFEAYRRKGMYGDAYIHQKMKQKGLFTDQHIPVEEEIENAVALVQRKAEITPKLLTDYRKAAAFLLRRGFSGSTIISALREFDFCEIDEE